MTRPLVIATSLRHGGAWLVTSMLRRGGLPVVDTTGLAFSAVWPDPAWTAENRARELADYRGEVLPLVDPEAALPLLPALPWPRIAVFVERGPNAIARRRMAAAFAGRPELRAGDAKAPAGGVVAAWRDQASAIAAVRASGTPLVVLHFEAILAEPAQAARTLAGQLAPWWPAFDFRAAAAAVRLPEPAGGLGHLAIGDV